MLPRPDGLGTTEVKGMASGIRRSSAQSPPPITFPARAAATATPFSARYASRYAPITTSAAALLALYGSSARTVRIVSAEDICLPVGIGVLKVLVDLVGGDGNHNAKRMQRPQGIQDICGALHIGREGRQRVAIAGPHKGLRCQVKYDFWIRPADQFGKRLRGTDVAKMAVGKLLDTGQRKEIRLRRRRQADSRSAAG